MTINEYQVQAMRFANPKCLNIFNAALGLTGEAGEFADLVKKINFHGHTQDNDHLIKELGDVLWYVALGAEVLGTDLETVAQANINKLWNRYPNGFEEKRSINREKNDI
nr:MAG TPA: NTP-PPase-like protein [Caudoviricetes sp.]